MPTPTTTYSLSKPTVGGDDNTWGSEINNNLDKLDDLLDGTLGITPNLVAGWEVGGTPITASGAEINYLTGASSNIQTQLDALGTIYEDGPDDVSSGAIFDFSSIPSGVNEIDILLYRVSSDAVSSNDFLIQIGTGGVPTTGGYISFATNFVTNASSSSGFVMRTSSPSTNFTVSMQLRRVPGTNQWLSSHIGGASSVVLLGNGEITLGGDLDIIRLRLVSGGGFDTGNWSIRCRK